MYIGHSAANKGSRKSSEPKQDASLAQSKSVERTAHGSSVATQVKVNTTLAKEKPKTEEVKESSRNYEPKISRNSPLKVKTPTHSDYLYLALYYRLRFRYSFLI